MKVMLKKHDKFKKKKTTYSKAMKNHENGQLELSNQKGHQDKMDATQKQNEWKLVNRNG